MQTKERTIPHGIMEEFLKGDLDETRNTVRKFRSAILLKSMLLAMGLRGVTAYSPEHSKILSQTGSMTSYEGYYRAPGLGCSACKSTYSFPEECTAMIKGRSCPFPFLTGAWRRRSGMVVFKLASLAGWDIYPVGSAIKNADLPFASHRSGLIPAKQTIYLR